MKKLQIEKSETSEISEISEILFRIFLLLSIRFCPTAKIENSDLKISEKNLLDFWGFRVFNLAEFKQIIISTSTEIIRKAGHIYWRNS